MRQNWVIKFPEQILVNDIIVYNQNKYQIIKTTKCTGAGLITFGEYWSIKAKPVALEYFKHYVREETSFWLYNDEPVPTLKGET